jgi:hypothetical protein
VIVVLGFDAPLPGSTIHCTKSYCSPAGVIPFRWAIFAFASSTIRSTENRVAFWLGGYWTKVSRNFAALNTPSWSMKTFLTAQS